MKQPALLPCAAALLALLALPFAPAVADPGAPALRDPLQPPAALRAASAPEAAADAGAPALRQILVVDGRRYVVEGTRLRGVGDKLGDARIERIGDDAVWLRRAGGVQRVPLFAGITRRPAAPEAATPAPAPSSARTLARANRLRPATDTP